MQITTIGWISRDAPELRDELTEHLQPLARQFIGEERDPRRVATGSREARSKASDRYRLHGDARLFTFVNGVRVRTKSRPNSCLIFYYEVQQICAHRRNDLPRDGIL